MYLPHWEFAGRKCLIHRSHRSECTQSLDGHSDELLFKESLPAQARGLVSQAWTEMEKPRKVACFPDFPEAWDGTSVRRSAETQSLRLVG